ncbi:WD40-repeat-containing domain protein [Xylogone sp. PMI_703]|nr:WD40-repeat-containing domain protein [Xylogone sp. PMI_703]
MLILLLALVLTRLSTLTGNIQTTARKQPPRLIRNGASKEATTPAKPPSSPPEVSTSIDPLSHHILKRTNTENTIPQKLRNPGLPESPITEVGSLHSPGSPDPGNSPGRFTPNDLYRSDSNLAKEKKKGVSFLSRFAINVGKKKDLSVDHDDDESELGDHRPEGMNAHVFSSSIEANGYIPQHKEPPRYIKVRAWYKKTREFNRMFLAQELTPNKRTPNGEKDSVSVVSDAQSVSSKAVKDVKHSGAIWATEFSKDGKYLAAAGRDQIVRVWAVISTPEERKAHEREEEASGSGGEKLSAPVFQSKPIREFEGHTGDVLDLSWSKNNFLLSSSMDKTVRLWHISRQECLCTFKHKDFVTSIAFHPRDDRFFLAGSLDSVLRLWSIPDKVVAFWTQLPDLITAVAFTPDGKTALAGVLSGLCLFYETEGLKYNTQIHVRSSRGKNAKGSKITGIRTMTFPRDDPNGETKILISSNDSRVRIYNLKDKALEVKLRGHENTCSQIKASFSDDGQYVICGSEDRKAYIWSLAPEDVDNKDKRPIELFEAHSDMVTAAVFAPTKSRQLLSTSGDPIYDLCNPPPVTLLSKEESHASSLPMSDKDKRNSDPASETVKKPEESPAYIARCQHPDGNILITADHTGSIKVFRQDCAYHKRRHDQWETASTFSKKMLGRSGSIRTKHSNGSRRNSVSQASLAPSNNEHIVSWRNAVNDTSSIRSGIIPSRNDRSISPGTVTTRITAGHNTSPSTTRSQKSQNKSIESPRPSTRGAAVASIKTNSPPMSLRRTPTTATMPPTPSFQLYSASDNSGLSIDSSGRSYQFWNVSTWKGAFNGNNNPNNNNSNGKVEGTGDGLRPPVDRWGSFASKLSSEEGTDRESMIDESEGEALSCKKCGGKDFRAKKAVIGSKGQRLVCTRCGTAVE